MGDAAGEASHGFHFLGLAKLVFKRAAFGDVFGEEFEDDPFAAVQHRASGDAHHGGGVVLALPFRGQAFEGLGGAEVVGEVEPFIVFGVEPEDVLANQFLGGGVAEQLDERGIGVENLAGRIAAANAVGGVGHKRSEVQLGAAQVLLGGTQSCVEPADQHGHEEEQREAKDGGPQLVWGVFACEREIGAYGQGEGGSDHTGLPATVPGADHDRHSEQREAALRNVRQQHRGNERQGCTEHGHSVPKDGSACGRGAK